MMKLKACAFVTFLLLFSAAVAQEQPIVPVNPNASKPIVITAQQTMEWHRNDSQYIARGQVIAIQADTKIESETLTADYRQDAKSNNDIYRLTAIENVKVSDQDSTAYGDKAVYDVDKGLAILTGQHLKLVMPDQIVTAKDRFEYWSDQGRANAIGKAHAIHGDDTIDADTLSAIFVQAQPGAVPVPKQAATSQTGNRQLSRLEGYGHVVITTPTEVLTGDRGVYHKDTNIAELFDHVTIKRGPNVLEGDSADVNMNTNVSRMHSGGKGKRVRGVFYPGTQNGTADASSSPHESQKTIKTDTAYKAKSTIKPMTTAKSSAPLWNTAIVPTPVTATPQTALPAAPSVTTSPITASVPVQAVPSDSSSSDVDSPFSSASTPEYKSR